MIASVRGPVGHVGLDHVVVEVGGVGMLVHTTPATASTCRRGSEASLATSLVVREDSLTLFGFSAPAERDMFETLQTVSGVGPRLALAMLSVMGPDQLALALSSGDTKALTTIPGIGAKSAERLVLELRDKVGAVRGAGTPATGGSPTGPAGVSASLISSLRSWADPPSASRARSWSISRCSSASAKDSPSTVSRITERMPSGPARLSRWRADRLSPSTTSSRASVRIRPRKLARPTTWTSAPRRRASRLGRSTRSTSAKGTSRNRSPRGVGPCRLTERTAPSAPSTVRLLRMSST